MPKCCWQDTYTTSYAFEITSEYWNNSPEGSYPQNLALCQLAEAHSPGHHFQHRINYCPLVWHSATPGLLARRKRWRPISKVHSVEALKAAALMSHWLILGGTFSGCWRWLGPLHWQTRTCYFTCLPADTGAWGPGSLAGEWVFSQQTTFCHLCVFERIILFYISRNDI